MSLCSCSFVRSVSMDKWKDLELEKMKAGGNERFRSFLELQDDFDPDWSLQEKYNSRAAALFRDKVSLIIIQLRNYVNSYNNDFRCWNISLKESGTR